MRFNVVLMILGTLAVGSHAPAESCKLPLGGRAGDDFVTFIYDPIGEWWLQHPSDEAGAESLTTFELTSSIDFFTGPVPSWINGLFDIYTPRKVFKLDPAGFQSLERAGAVAGLNATQVQEILRVDGSYAGGGSICGDVDFRGGPHQELNSRPVASIDLGTLNLGAKIDGPVGPEVNSTITFSEGEQSIGIADLISSVSCDERFANDCSAGVVDGNVVYTYKYQVTPGVDTTNDPPFPSPDSVVPFDDVVQFNFEFPAYGFNGVAGFDFSEARTAIGSTDISILQLDDGSLTWGIPNSSNWDTGESITFFWQTSQRPTGPTGVYSSTNRIISGSGIGPMPAVPEPSMLALTWMALGVFASSVRRRVLAAHKCR